MKFHGNDDESHYRLYAFILSWCFCFILFFSLHWFRRWRVSVSVSVHFHQIKCCFKTWIKLQKIQYKLCKWLVVAREEPEGVLTWIIFSIANGIRKNYIIGTVNKFQFIFLPIFILFSLHRLFLLCGFEKSLSFRRWLEKKRKSTRQSFVLPLCTHNLCWVGTHR